MLTSDDVKIGDAILIRAGEIIPVDGLITSPVAVVDESALTGEPIPVTRQAGENARSGTLNAGDTFEMTATATAEESTYAGIVRLVTAAQTAKAPFIRVADRYALLLLPVTFLVAGGVGSVGGPHSGTRCLGGRHSMPAYTCRARRLHCWRLSGSTPRYHHQGRRSARCPSPDAYCVVRQDRHSDGRRCAAGAVETAPDVSADEVLRSLDHWNRLRSMSSLPPSWLPPSAEVFHCRCPTMYTK